MKKFFSILLFSALIAACSVSPQAPAINTDEDLNSDTITTTFSVLNDVVKNIAPANIEVKSLMGVGLDPHEYTPTPSDIDLLSSSDMIFAIGLDLEASMDTLLDSLSNSKPVLKVGESLDESKLIPAEEDAKLYDPHVWFDIDLWKDVSLSVKNTLLDYYPEQELEINTNFENYLSELNELDIYIDTKMQELPVENRILVTAHDAFSYFAQKYDFELYTLQGISTESDYSIKDLNDIVDTIVSKKVKSIFTESSVSKQAILTIQEKANEADLEVKIGGELYSDSLGDVGSIHESYVDTFKHNVDIIVDNLK